MTKVDMHIPGKSDLDVSFDGSRKIHQEAPFERYISRKVAGLEHSGWALSPDDTGFDPNDALVFDDFVAWLEATAPEKLDKMRREKGARWADQLKRALVKSLERNGTVLTLRKGFQMAGYQTIECMAGYPDDERVPGARERYDANILRFMHQVHYQTAGSKSLDFVLFVNGIPVATGEVKTELTQTVRDAIDEYADERKPVEPDGGRKNPLLMYKRGAVVHFAVSEDEVWMCTNLGPFPSKSARPRFLPFNLGRDGGAGNPDAPEGEYRTHYLWDTILQRDNWLSIFDRFVFEEVEDRQDASGRWRRQATQIFPRYHQFDAERKVLADAREHGAGRRYLIEHSAGSGKTETISWAAHDLARLRRADGEKMFSSVVVVTDRLSLDQNIKKTISQLSKVTGQVVMIGRDERGNAVSDGSKSSQLVEALRQKREIVVVTIQTFLYAWPDIAVLPELDGAGFAVIVDEAHSSQEGSSAASLKTAFNAAADKLKFERMLDFDDDSGDDGSVMDAYFAQMQASNLMPPNVSFLAFTATPKAETKTLFGTPTGEEDEDGNPVMGSFHLYPMRQAIEEGYIIDPLSGYVPLKTLTRIEDESEDADGRLVDERRARRKIAKWRSLHPTNVMEKAKWIIDHFVDNVAPLLNGEAKAMIVTSGRPEVVRYKYAIEAYLRARPDLDPAKVEPRLRFKVPGEPLVAFSQKVLGDRCVLPEDEYLEDNPFALIERGYEYTEANMNPTGQGPVERAFDRPESRLLIVTNKFQTGFDQKKLVALYVDKPLGNAIEIVQTYSRVNRTCSGKDRVFVVDFVNDPETVLAAFKTYDKGATMSAAQDPNVVYDLKDALDAADVFATRDVEGFKEALYRSKGLAAGGESDAYRTALYSAVSGPAEIFRERFAAARDSYETWLECANRAEAAGEAEEAERAKRSADEAAGRVAELMTFRKKLSKYCSAYTFLSQALDFGDPDLEVFYSFAKLLGHRIAGTSLDDVDVRGLVLRDFRISAQKVPEGGRGRRAHADGRGRLRRRSQARHHGEDRGEAEPHVGRRGRPPREGPSRQCGLRRRGGRPRDQHADHEHEQHEGGCPRGRAPAQHRHQGPHVDDEQRAGRPRRAGARRPAGDRAPGRPGVRPHLAGEALRHRRARLLPLEGGIDGRGGLRRGAARRPGLRAHRQCDQGRLRQEAPAVRPEIPRARPRIVPRVRRDAAQPRREDRRRCVDATLGHPDEARDRVPADAMPGVRLRVAPGDRRGRRGSPNDGGGIRRHRPALTQAHLPRGRRGVPALARHREERLRGLRPRERLEASLQGAGVPGHRREEPQEGRHGDRDHRPRAQDGLRHGARQDAVRPRRLFLLVGGPRARTMGLERHVPAVLEEHSQVHPERDMGHRPLPCREGSQRGLRRGPQGPPGSPRQEGPP